MGSIAEAHGVFILLTYPATQTENTVAVGHRKNAFLPPNSLVTLSGTNTKDD